MVSKNPLNTFVNAGRLELDSKKPTRTPKSAYTKGWVQGRGSQEREHKAPEWLRVQTRPYDLCTKVHGPPRRPMLRAEPHKGCRTAGPAKHTERYVWVPAGWNRQTRGVIWERLTEKWEKLGQTLGWFLALSFTIQAQETNDLLFWVSSPHLCYPTAS